MYGCRVVQKALEYVSTQRLIALVSEVSDSQIDKIKIIIIIDNNINILP